VNKLEKDLAILAELQRITRLAAGPIDANDNIKSAIARAARRLGLNYRRARSFWYASPETAVRAVEADRLRAAEVRLLREQRLRLLAEADEIEARLNARERPDAVSG
jgi:hypothetical protein